MKIETEAGERQEEKRTTPASAAEKASGSPSSSAAAASESTSSLSLSQFPSPQGKARGTTAATASSAVADNREQERNNTSSGREGGALLEVRDAAARTVKMEQPEQERQNQTTKENSNPDSNNASLGNSPPGKSSSPLSAPPSTDKSGGSDGGSATKSTPKPPSTPSRADADARHSSDRSPSSSSKQSQSPSRRQRPDHGGRGSATLTPPRSSSSAGSSSSATYRPPPYSDAGGYHHHGMPHHPLSGPGPGPPPPPPHGASAGAHHPPHPSYHPYYGQPGDHPPPPYAAAPAPGGAYAAPPYQTGSRYPPPPATYGGQGGPPPPHYHHSHPHPPPSRAYPPPSHGPPPPHHPYSHHHYGGAPPPPSHPYGPPSSSTASAAPYHHPGQGGGPSMHYGAGPPPPPHGDHHSSSHGEHHGGSQPPPGQPPSSAGSQSSSYHHREPTGPSHSHGPSSYSSSTRGIGPSSKDDPGSGRNVDSRNSGRGTSSSAGSSSSATSGYSRKRSLDGYRGISTDSSGRSTPPHPPSSSGASSKSAFAAVHHRSSRGSSRHHRSGSSNSSSTSSTASTITARNSAGDGGGAIEGSASRLSSAPPPLHHGGVAGDHRGGGEISSASSSTTASPVFRPKSSGAPVPSSSRVRASPGGSHRRLHSTSSTSSSLSMGGLSMSSYDGRAGHEKHASSAGPMVEASPKRKRTQQEGMDQGEDDDTSGTPKRGNFSSDHTYHERDGHGRQAVARSVDRFSHRRGYRASSKDDDDRSVHPAAPMDRSASSAPPPGTSPSHRRELTIDSTSSGNRDAGIFLTLSTSPINCVIDEVTQMVSGDKGPSTTTDRDAGDALADTSIEVSIDQTGAATRPDEGPPVKSSAPRDSSPLQYMSDKRDETLSEPKSSEIELSALPYQRQNNSSFDSNGSGPSSSPLAAGMVPSGDVTTEEHSLNRHLRCQSFTPLPHVVTSGEGERDGQNATSPTFNPGLSSIAPQLSWSIAGDTPPLGDIADWAEQQQRQKREPPSPSARPAHRRHGSNTSLDRTTGGNDRRSGGGAEGSSSTAGGRVHSPSPMIFWREESGSSRERHSSSSAPSRSRQHPESMSPSSDVAMEEALGHSTPLPVFFDQDKGQDEDVMRDEAHDHPPRNPGRQRSRSHHRYSEGYSPDGPRRSSPTQWESGRRSEPPSSGPEMFAHEDNGPGGHHRKLPKPHATKIGAVRADGIPSWSDEGYSPSSPGVARRDDPGRYSYRPDGRSHMRDYRSDQGKRMQGEDQRDDAYNMGYPGRESREGPPPDYHRPATVYSTPYDPHGRDAVMGTPGDRVRNLRGRGPPPSSHHPPPPIHIPPMSSPHHHHHPLTSPMAPVMPKSGGPGAVGMWGHHHSHHPHQHHRGAGPPGMMMPGLDMTPSKRKCVPLKPPIPSKFQGDIEKVKSAQVPEFTSLVNFPVHMSQKQAMNLPEGMRCCVMCGQPCPCPTSKNKKGAGAKVAGGPDAVAPLGSHGQGSVGGGMYQPGAGPGGPGGSAYAIIPTQNKGLCTMCDVNVWVVTSSGLEIKWCKGCKNFRPWAAFGDKGLATKCVRCRERQREKYAAQKEEKEKARLGSAKSNSGSSTGSSSGKGSSRA